MWRILSVWVLVLLIVVPGCFSGDSGDDNDDSPPIHHFQTHTEEGFHVYSFMRPSKCRDIDEEIGQGKTLACNGDRCIRIDIYSEQALDPVEGRWDTAIDPEEGIEDGFTAIYLPLTSNNTILSGSGGSVEITALDNGNMKVEWNIMFEDGKTRSGTFYAGTYCGE